MSEMVERVARELAVIEDHNNWEDFVLAARAAISVMREPTEAMMKAPAAKDTEQKGTVGGFLDFWNCDDVWKSMIDEALR